ncbi:MAG: BatD family protein [bacterium]|nr:BatD family protein [bacterium]
MIGAISVKVGATTYKTKPIEIDVAAGAVAQPAAAAQPGQAGAAQLPPCFVQLQADKTNVFLNEQILLTLSLYFRDVDVRSVAPPAISIPSCTMHEVGSGQDRKDINGLVYTVVRFQKLAVPLATGVVQIEPVALSMQIREAVAAQQRGFPDDNFFGGGIFDEMFGRFRTAERVVQSNPLTIYVQPLPLDQRPPSFAGAVGTFTLRASVAPTNVPAGDPLTLTVELNGVGNMDEAAVSLPTNGPEFRVYDPETQRETSISGARLVGRRTYTQMWVPQSEAASEIPAITFSYFDPTRTQYQTLTQGPFSIHVSPAPAGAVRIADFRPAPESAGSVRVLKQDILANIADYTRLGPATRAYRQPWFIVCCAAPPLAWALLTILARWQRRMQSDTAFSRRTNALGRMQERLRRANKALHQHDAKAFYGLVADTIAHYIGDCRDVSAQQISAQALPALLEASAVAPATCADAARLLHVCDFARFGSGTFDVQVARQHLRETELLMKRLVKELR